MNLKDDDIDFILDVNKIIFLEGYGTVASKDMVEISRADLDKTYCSI